MQSKFHGLPPLKRFRLMQQEENQNQESNPSKKNPKSSENSTTPTCLPAKKRKECRDSPPPPPISTTNTTFCLPAKKRIWAIQPFDLDLNLEYEPPSNQEIQPKELEQSPKLHIQAAETNNEEEKPEPKDSETTENSVNEDEEDDDGIVCAICDSTDGDPTDPIVLCDGCDLMVHTTCYGHPFTNGIPEGDWFCAQCLESKSLKNSDSTNFSCCLCPVSGGASKPTTDGRWAHLVCAIYVPEVFFVDSQGREGIDCSRVLKRRWERKCCVCELKNGCVVDCSEPKCPLAFHVTCGLKEEFCIEYRQGKNRGAVVAAFCRAHTDLWKKQEQTGKFKIVARDEDKK